MDFSEKTLNKSGQFRNPIDKRTHHVGSRRDGQEFRLLDSTKRQLKECSTGASNVLMNSEFQLSDLQFAKSLKRFCRAPLWTIFETAAFRILRSNLTE